MLPIKKGLLSLVAILLMCNFSAWGMEENNDDMPGLMDPPPKYDFSKNQIQSVEDPDGPTITDGQPTNPPIEKVLSDDTVRIKNTNSNPAPNNGGDNQAEKSDLSMYGPTDMDSIDSHVAAIKIIQNVVDYSLKQVSKRAHNEAEFEKYQGLSLNNARELARHPDPGERDDLINEEMQLAVIDGLNFKLNSLKFNVEPEQIKITDNLKKMLASTRTFKTLGETLFVVSKIIIENAFVNFVTKTTSNTCESLWKGNYTAWLPNVLQPASSQARLAELLKYTRCLKNNIGSTTSSAIRSRLLNIAANIKSINNPNDLKLFQNIVAESRSCKDPMLTSYLDSKCCNLAAQPLPKSFTSLEAQVQKESLTLKSQIVQQNKKESLCSH